MLYKYFTIYQTAFTSKHKKKIATQCYLYHRMKTTLARVTLVLTLQCLYCTKTLHFNIIITQCAVVFQYITVMITKNLNRVNLYKYTCISKHCPSNEAQ